MNPFLFWTRTSRKDCLTSHTCIMNDILLYLEFHVRFLILKRFLLTEQSINKKPLAIICEIVCEIGTESVLDFARQFFLKITYR